MKSSYPDDRKNSVSAFFGRGKTSVQNVPNVSVRNRVGNVQGTTTNEVFQRLNVQGRTMRFANQVATRKTGSQKLSPKNPALKMIDWIVKLSIYLTAFLLPLFFLLNVPSVFGLSKQLLLSAIIGTGFLAWVGQMAWRNEIRFRNNFILIPVVVWLGIYALSSIFSVYQEQSFWGYFGGEAEAFITLLFFVAGFLLIFNNIQSKKEAFLLSFTFLVGGVMVAIAGVMAIYGFNKFYFAITVGSIYAFSFYLAALFLLAQGLFLSKTSSVVKIMAFLFSVLFAYVLVVVNLKITYLGLILCLIILLGITIARGKIEQNRGKIVPMVFLVIFALLFLLKVPIIKTNITGEPILTQGISSSIALNSIKQKPLLGFGPANYDHAYKLSRPVNKGIEYWANNYATGGSYFMTLVATTGILGTLTFLFLIGSGVVYFFREVVRTIATRHENRTDGGYIFLGVGLSWFFLTLVLFFYSANITLLMLWWFSLALFLVLSSFNSDQAAKEFVTNSATPKSSLVLSFVFVLAIIGLVAAIYLQSQKFVAATKFNQALNMQITDSGKLEELANRIEQAIQVDPNRDIYYRNMANVLFAIAHQRVIEKKQDLSADDSAFISNMIIGAKQAVDQARSLDSSNADNQVATAQIYEGVLLTMDDADQKAVEFYQNALKYDPFNPILYQKLANIYLTMADVEIAKNKVNNQKGEKTQLSEEANKNLALAKEQAEKALSIKSDFASARFLIVGVYERRGEIDQAIQEEKKNKQIFFNDPFIPFRLGLIYYRNNDINEAKKEFESALALDGNYSNARYFLGLILDQENNRQGALEQFKKVAELNPNNEEVKKIIANLENGKKALDGLQQDSNMEQAKKQNEKDLEDKQQSTSSKVNSANQPIINPDVKQQQIPEEATPAIEQLEEDASSAKD